MHYYLLQSPSSPNPWEAALSSGSFNRSIDNGIALCVSVLGLLALYSLVSIFIKKV